MKTITEKQIFEMTEDLLDTVIKAKKEDCFFIVLADSDAEKEISIEWELKETEFDEDETIELFVFNINNEPRIALHRHESEKVCLEFLLIGSDSHLYYPFCNLFGFSDDEITNHMLATFIDWTTHIKSEVSIDILEKKR